MLFLAIMFAFAIVQVVAPMLPLITQATVIISQLVVFLGGAIFFRVKFGAPDTRWPTFRSLGMSVPALVAVLTASISLAFLANALGGLTLQVFPGLESIAEDYQQQTRSLMLPEDQMAQILAIVAVTLVAPVAEEILFRGTILPEQRRNQLAVHAILVNGILFSLMHLNPVAFVSLAVVGCYFAHVTVRSGSIWGAILGHGILNLVNGVILLQVYADVQISPAELTWTEVGVALLVSIPLSAFLWWWSIRLIGGEPDDHS